MIYSYLRVSTEEQRNSGKGLESQRKSIQQHLERNDLRDVSQEFEEVGWSRDDDPYSRPRFSDLLNTAKTGDTILVARFDRIGTLLECCIVANHCMKKGIRLVCVEGNIDASTPEGRIQMYMYGIMSELDLMRIRTRTKAAMKNLKALGNKYCGRVFGKSVTDEGKLIDNAQEQALIQRIVETHREGVAYAEIARRLNNEGIPSANGGVWRHTAVRNIVQRHAPAPNTPVC